MVKVLQIGIVSTGLYLPEEYLTGREIAEKAGIPTNVVEEKMGIKKNMFLDPMTIRVKWELSLPNKRLKEQVLIH